MMYLPPYLMNLHWTFPDLLQCPCLICLLPPAYLIHKFPRPLIITHPVGIPVFVSDSEKLSMEASDSAFDSMRDFISDFSSAAFSVLALASDFISDLLAVLALASDFISVLAAVVVVALATDFISVFKAVVAVVLRLVFKLANKVNGL